MDKKCELVSKIATPAAKIMMIKTAIVLLTGVIDLLEKAEKDLVVAK